MLNTIKPYRGLVPYSEADSRFFFGRESDRDSILDNLELRRLTILYGESGVGKSSVLRAGVARYFRQAALQNLKKYNHPKSIIVVFPPDPPPAKQAHSDLYLSWQEDDPLHALKQQIAKDIKKLLPKLKPPDPHLSFVDTLQAWTEGFDQQPGCGDLFIILDQFEEYFFYHPNEVGLGTFLSEFPRAVNRANLRVNFLISIRADSLAKLDRFKGKIPELFENELRINHLNRKSATDAIVKPIREAYNHQVPEAAQFQIEDDLVEVVLNEVSQILPKGDGVGGREKLKAQQSKEIEAPYLQMVMTVLWEKELAEHSQCLRLKTLRELKGADKIVEQYLNSKMDVLSLDEQYAASVIFQHLVTPYGTKIAYPVLELEQSTELDQAKLQSLLKQLDDQRIVRSTRASDEQPRYEIFHDRLIKPIQNWLKDWEIDAVRQERAKVLKQTLPIQALRQHKRNQDALAALLARQAYCFEAREHLQMLSSVTHALWKILSTPYFSNVLQCNQAIWSIAILNAQRFVVGGAGGELYLWTLPGQTPKVAHKHKGDVYALALSADHRLLVSGSQDHTIRLWNLSANEIVYQGKLGHHDQAVTCLALSPDGELLASGSEDNTIRLWKVKHPYAKPIILGTHNGTVRSLVFRDETTLASGGEDRLIKLWNLQTHPATFVNLDRHQDQVRSVAFSPDGQLLASCGDDEVIWLWDVSQPDPLPIEQFSGHKERIRAIAFDPNRPILASASDDQTIRLWDLRQPETEPEILRGHYFDILSLVFSPDSKRLISTSGDNTIRLWDLSDSVAVAQIPKGHDQQVVTVAFSRDGTFLASGGFDKTVRVWKLDALHHTAEEFYCFQGTSEEDWQRVTSVAFSSDGQFLAAGSADRQIRIWTLHQPENPPRILAGHDDQVTSVAFHPCKPLLASGSVDCTVRVWDLEKPNPTAQVLVGHQDHVTSVAFSEDGQQLASGSNDRTIRVWNMEQFEAEPVVLADHQGRVWSVAFNRDGLLASASNDWTVRLWNLHPQPDQVFNYLILEGHSSWVSSVAFSPDGKTLASSSYDRSIRLWNLSRLDWKTPQLDEEPILLEGHEQSVISVAFNADGKTLASSSYDASVRLWMTNTQDLADQVCQKVLRNLTIEEWKQFMGTDIPYEQTCPL